MTYEPGDAADPKHLAAERALLLSSALATLNAVRADISIGIAPDGAEPWKASPPALRALPGDLLLAPMPRDNGHPSTSATRRTLEVLGRVRQRSLADFLS